MKKKSVLFSSIVLIALMAMFSLKASSQSVTVSQFTGVRTTPTSNVSKLTLTALASYSTGWYRFDYEKSSTSTGPFSSIGTQSITSNSSTTYTYFDNNFIATSFYRIKFFNRNGKTLYSSIIGVSH